MSAPLDFTYHYTTKETIASLASSWVSLFKKRIDKNPTDPKKPLVERAHSIATQILSTLEERHAHLILAKKGETPCAILIVDDEDDYLKIRFLVSNVLNIEAKGSGTHLIRSLKTRFGATRILKLVPERSLKYWENLDFIINPKDRTTMIYNEVSIAPKKSPARTRFK